MTRTDNRPRLTNLELFRLIEARVRAAGSAQHSLLNSGSRRATCPT